MSIARDVVKFFRLAIRHGPGFAIRQASNDLAHRFLRLTGVPRELEALRARADALETQMDAMPRMRDIQAMQADSVRRMTSLLVESQAYVATQSLTDAPTLSVIMPVHDRVHLLSRAVDSVLAQVGAPYELVIVDDGSSEPVDSSVVPSLAHPAVRLVRQPHLGASAARNRGIAQSTGDVLVYLDSDNTMYPGYLSALARAYGTATDAGCAYAAMLWDDGLSGVHLRHDPFDWAALRDQHVNLDLNCFSHRRDVWERLGGFDETLARYVDLDLVLRYTKHSPPLRIPAVAARYDHSKSAPRISTVEPSAPNLVRIKARHTDPSANGLRVLLFCLDYPQLSETYVDAEVAWLVRQGAHVEVFACETPGAMGRARVPIRTGDFEKALDEFLPDIVHVHWLPLADGASLAAQKRGIPVTVRCHSFEFNAENYARCAGQGAVRSIYVFPHFLDGLNDPLGKGRSVAACFDSTRFFPRHKRDPRMVLRAAACLETKDVDLFFHVAARSPRYRFVLALARISRRPELPERFRALNAKLGNPVELRFDVQHDEMTDLVGRAGVYLHTFGFIQAFGMPMSIIESLASGAVVLVRRSPESVALTGSHAIYYETAEQAADRLNDMLDWPHDEWQTRSSSGAEFAYTHYADEHVMPTILRDWQAQLAEMRKDVHRTRRTAPSSGRGLQPHPATATRGST